MYKNIFIVCIVLCLSSTLWSQLNDCYGDERVVSTDWTKFNPSSNGQYPNEWDWTGVSTGYRYEINLNGSTYSIVPPFYPRNFNPGTLGYDTDPFGNVDKFTFAFIDNMSPADLDYYPSDGWELLYKDFGQPGSEREFAYFVLYNKYSGIVRPFIYILTSEVSSFNRVVIKMKFKDLTDARTALMSHANPVMKSIKNFNPENYYAVPDFYEIGNQGFWLYADFPVTFDPCTCNSESDLLFEVGIINQASITLKGTINGQVEPLATSTSTSKGSFMDGVNTVTSAFSKINQGFTEALSLTSAFQDLRDQSSDNANSAGEEAINEAEAESDAETGTNVLALGKLLLKAAGSTKIAGALGVMVNLFTGNWTSAKTGTPTKMDVDLGVDLSGELEFDYGPYTFYARVPGSVLTDATSSAPIYDNTLGVFSILETPMLDMMEYKRINNFLEIGKEKLAGYGSFSELQLSGPLKYAINPAARVKPVKILANIQFRFNYESPSTWFPMESSAYNSFHLKEGHHDTSYTARKRFHPFHPRGPVLLPPSTEPINHSTYGSLNGGNYIDYFTDYAVPIAAGNMLMYQAYTDMVKRYGNGIEIAVWPNNKSDLDSSVVFQTPVMPIDELHNYSFYLWDSPAGLKENVSMVVKTYAFFVPEDDPTRDPLLQISTYETSLKELNLGQSLYYVGYDQDLAIDYTTPPSSTWESSTRSQVAYWSDRNNGSPISDLLMPISSEIIIDDNFERSGYLNAGGPYILDPLFAPNPSGSGVIFYESGALYAGDVNIVTDIILQPGVEITIYGNNINVSPEVNLPPGVRLVATGRNTEANQASQSVIDEMCSSSEYRVSSGLQRQAAPESATEQDEVLVDIKAGLFPNPAKGSTTLRYELQEENAQVRISIVDVLGQERILLDAQQAAGVQELNINLRDYPAGLYYCRLMVNGAQQALPLRVQ